MAEARGRRAETLAALWLFLKGYSIAGRREKTPTGEIDLIARKGQIIAFVEVKARPSVSAALESVSPRQQQRIVRAASMFMARRPEMTNLTPRFDVVAISPWRWPRHLRSAFWPDGADGHNLI